MFFFSPAFCLKAFAQQTGHARVAVNEGFEFYENKKLKKSSVIIVPLRMYLFVAPASRPVERGSSLSSSARSARPSGINAALVQQVSAMDQPHARASVCSRILRTSSLCNSTHSVPMYSSRVKSTIRGTWKMMSYEGPELSRDLAIFVFRSRQRWEELLLCSAVD